MDLYCCKQAVNDKDNSEDTCSMTPESLQFILLRGTKNQSLIREDKKGNKTNKGKI